MMKNIKLYICILTLAIASFACSEKDLDVTSTQEMGDSYYTEDEQVESALWAAYNRLQIYDNWGTTFMSWSNFASDDAHTGGESPNDQIGYQNADNYTCSPTDAGNNLGRNWQDFFRGIYRCNLVIDNVKLTKDNRIQAVAEAKFLKALYYFYLTRMFGGLPILKSTPLPTEKFKRASQDETYNYIETLLNEAIAMKLSTGGSGLQERTSKTDPSNGRATLGSAQALLGKVYVYHGKNTEAIAILNKITANANYELMTNYADIFNPANEHCAESLFEINFTKLQGPASTNHGNPEVQLYGCRSGDVQINENIASGWGFNQPSIDLVTAFKNAGDKIRLDATAISSDSLQKLHDIFLPGAAPINWVNEISGYWDRKHTGNPNYTVGGAVWRYTNNQILLRLGEVYLLLAEAYNKTGDDASAQVALNKVRERAKLPAVTANGASLLAAIKLERRLELALEGERYFDLVRWGDADAVLGPLGYTSGRPGKESNGLFPIPQAEINRTEGEFKLEQNPGY